MNVSPATTHWKRMKVASDLPQLVRDLPKNLGY